MHRRILIDAPGAGDRIMKLVGDWFTLGVDHSFATYHGDRFLGGFVTCEYLGNSMRAHMAADDKRWFSRELAWLVCDYVFNQSGCQKMVTGVRSDDVGVIRMCRRGGWHFETVIPDLYEPGVGMVVMAMHASDCRWLKHQPKYFWPVTPPARISGSELNGPRR